MKICILGGGFIGRFYAESLHGQRNKDRVHVVYARRQETAERFAADYQIHPQAQASRLLPFG